MGGGLKAYKLTMERQALNVDLADNFSEDPDIIPASVGKQEAYFEGWTASLRT